MTGQLLKQNIAASRAAHTHAVICFVDRPFELHFRDPRRFGRVLLISSALPARQGIDPFTVQKAIFIKTLAQGRGRIKSALMNQGIIAGINAALKVKGEEPLILRRDQAYIGVMLDDLVTRELEEPYRLMTSRAEYRLLLRQDNADLRLTPIAQSLGLVSRERYMQVENKRDRIAEELKRLERMQVNPSQRITETLEAVGAMALTTNISALEFLRRQRNSYKTLLSIGLGDTALSDTIQEQVEVEAQYTGYIAKQNTEVERVRRVEDNIIPEDFDYVTVNAFRKEAREKLSRFRPLTIGQASRISGVNPTDVSILMVALEKHARVAQKAG
jgi:tRNA uridine 5-carboxymethylaminomethyl modification enzyme